MSEEFEDIEKRQDEEPVPGPKTEESGEGEAAVEAEEAPDESEVLVAEVAPETEEPEDPKNEMVQKVAAALKDDEGERFKVNVMDLATGKIFEMAWFRRQVPFVIMIVVMIVVYISNRYAAQQEIMQLDKLRKQLNVSRNYATARSAEVVERMRESKVIEFLRHTPDSDLTHASEPPVRIKLDD